MHWYFVQLKNWGEFSGRAHRKEYWMFILWHMIVYVCLFVIDSMFGFVSAEVGIGVLSGVYWLYIIIPGIALGVRRLHDTGRSGLWLLIAFVPLIGAIVILVFALQDSDPDENQYGPNPKLEVQ